MARRLGRLATKTGEKVGLPAKKGGGDMELVFFSPGRGERLEGKTSAACSKKTLSLFRFGWPFRFGFRYQLRFRSSDA